jgi:hypothetical protein
MDTSVARSLLLNDCTTERCQAQMTELDAISAYLAPSGHPLPGQLGCTTGVVGAPPLAFPGVPEDWMGLGPLPPAYPPLVGAGAALG